MPIGSLVSLKTYENVRRVFLFLLIHSSNYSSSTRKNFS